MNEIATCTIEYQQLPDDDNGTFIEVRRWDTASRSELIIEVGELDENGDLETTCQVLPYHLTIDQVLPTIGWGQ